MQTLDGEVRSFAEALGIGPEEVARLRRLLGLGEHDEAALKDLQAEVSAHAAEIADRFYERLMGFEETAALLQDPGQVERLKVALAAYTHRLLAGAYGLDYALHRVRIGIVHQRTGVKPRPYLAAWCHYLRLLIEEAFNAHVESATRARDAALALVKAAFFDIDLSLHTYLQADRDASEARFRDLVETLDAIVWEAAVHPLRFTFVNHRAEQVLGFPVAQWIEEADFWARHLHPADRDRVLAPFRGAGDGLRDQECDCRMLAADGRVVWLHGKINVVRPGVGEPLRLRGVMVDVTERQRMEEQLRQWQKMDALGRLAAVVTHEFNNQLGVICGYAEDLARRIDPSDPRREVADELVSAVRRAGGVTRPLLAFSRAETHEPQVVDLGAAISEMQGLLRGAAGRKVQLVIAVEPETCPVRAATGQIAQVLLNLVLNARDAMPDGGTVAVRASTVDAPGCGLSVCPGLRAAHCAMITVSDTGQGMDEATQTRLFEPFFTTKAPGKGTGLGLSTVYGIVRQLGGNISVQSEPGRGATFRICLPCAAPHA